MEHRTNLNITDRNVDQLIAIKNEFGLRSYDKVIEFLLEIKKSAKISKEFRCETCNKVIDLSPDINPKKIGLIHKHVTNTDCVGCIKMQYVLKSESNDKNSETIDKNEEKKDEILGYRNGIRITDVTDPNYDNKFFDIDIEANKKKILERYKTQEDA